ncbi:hypothetical protein HELRODRAFT_186886 [Helobdella robusta]|uniref:non-specific protein-tyrosine kinase n=1 Tax=Helobdella robusta TaxID=6412 RepID=T1FP44_HELRO|nr:hypothetical protein HELRODRAFT_186886 [Helobdella robusta]ESO07211.1 hypothetical protein HELRODRAFT_186886 [Helobdella robusta]
MENDSGYFITSKNIFPSISQLLDYYSKNNGLCCLLSRICPKMIPATEDLSKATRDKWEIDRRTLTKIEILGSGNFGEVWRGTWNSTRQVAIKLMKPGTMDKTTFLEEAAVMKKLRHPKLVRLYAVCSTEEPIYIVMEYIPHGCLQKYLKKDGGKKLTEPVLIDFAAQIASGMQYVESKCIIHRDLAARNVLVADNNMLKIADFGLSKSLKDNSIYVFKEGSKFPIKWTAIEAITSQNFSIKSDVWSFGILLVELVTYGNTPYPGMTAAEVQLKLQGAFRHPKPPGCSDELYEIMLQCWHANPQKRPTFDSLFHILDDFIIATQNSYE